MLARIYAASKLIGGLRAIGDLIKWLAGRREADTPEVPPSMSSDATWIELQRNRSGSAVLLAKDSLNRVVEGANDVTERDELLRFIARHPKAHTFRVARYEPLPAEKPPESPKPHVKWRPAQEGKYTHGRAGRKVDAIVLHYTVTKDTETALRTLTLPGREASAHYLVGRDGVIWQMVSERNTAWHCKGWNQRSIGIEHVAMPGEAMTPAQEAATTALIDYLLATYKLDPDAITAHKFTGNATLCPGNLFGPKGTEQEFLSWRDRTFSA